MGIPRLKQHLQPYSNAAWLSGQEVVIDGPSFAYHIHHVCLGTRATARTQLEAAISYKELGNVALAWLQALRTKNIVIRRLYFDGFLPSTKRDIRIGRVVQHTKQLIAFHQASWIPCPLSSGTQDGKYQNLFARRNVSAKLARLPAPPFLVPAVLEALLKSEDFRDVTEVVPGEADWFCAQSIKERNGLVLTGDSDLLVHDLGWAGAVAFFGDIEVDAEDRLHGSLFHPAAIASRLGLSEPRGLQALAFELKMSPSGTFSESLVNAKALKSANAHPEVYERFQREYATPPARPLDKHEAFGFLAVLRKLDPRISEYVLQHPVSSRIARRFTGNGTPKTTPHVFLPFLIDCPVRTNAWEISMATRQLAYGLINLLVPESKRISSVYEHKRQECISDGRELELPKCSQISEACSRLSDIISTQIPSKIHETKSKRAIDLWTALAVYQDVEWSYLNSKTCICQSVVCKAESIFLDSFLRTKDSWDILHMCAQIQGSYYSFRILKQITSLVVSRDGDSLPTPVLQLQNVLCTLPELSEVRDITEIVDILRYVKENNIIDIAYEILGIHASRTATGETNDRYKLHKKEKRKEAKDSTHCPGGSQKHPNPFDLLEVE